MQEPANGPTDPTGQDQPAMPFARFHEGGETGHDDASAGSAQPEMRSDPPSPGEPHDPGPGPRSPFSRSAFEAWEPSSFTVRFIKEHPALAVGVGVPLLAALAANPAVRGALRYAISPAGMMRIRQVMTVGAALGLIKRSR